MITWRKKEGLDESNSYTGISVYIVHADTDQELLKTALAVVGATRFNPGYYESRENLLYIKELRNGYEMDNISSNIDEILYITGEPNRMSNHHQGVKKAKRANPRIKQSLVQFPPDQGS